MIQLIERSSSAYVFAADCAISSWRCACRVINAQGRSRVASIDRPLYARQDNALIIPFSHRRYKPCKRCPSLLPFATHDGRSRQCYIALVCSSRICSVWSMATRTGLVILVPGEYCGVNCPVTEHTEHTEHGHCGIE